MLATLSLPRPLENISDCVAMFTGAGLMVIGVLVGPLAPNYPTLLVLWFVLGLGFSLTLTP